MDSLSRHSSACCRLSELYLSLPFPTLELDPSPSNMSTLADDLLNDFADSGSEDEGEQQNGLLQDEASPPANGIVNGHSRKSTSIDQDGGMELDDDEEEVEDEDEEMMNADTLKVDDIQDEEEAKAKVEKMQLGAVNDVRSVAGLMKTLEPVLEVGLTPFPLQDVLREAQGLHLLCPPPPCRK